MSTFRADCERCCGLCCVAPAYYASQGFGTDKRAGTPCPNLDDRDRCAIHGERPARGFTACAGFDCHGAGQWVTQVLFGGARWTDSPQLARQMFRAYTALLPVFELQAALEVLCTLPAAREGHIDLAALRRDALLLIRARVAAAGSRC